MKTISSKIFSTEKEEEDFSAFRGLDNVFWKDCNSRLHREGGPAVIGSDGYLAWYKRGCHHREDGPAIRDIDGSEIYYLDGTLLTKEQFHSLKKKP